MTNQIRQLLDIEGLAESIHVKKSTVYAWVHQRRIPYVKIGRLVKFDLNDINAWVESKKVKERNYH